MIRVFRAFGAYLGLCEPGWRYLDHQEAARALHATYERLAPDFGYETRPESRTSWAYVPPANRNLMVAVVEDLWRQGVVIPGRVDKRTGDLLDAL